VVEEPTYDTNPTDVTADWVSGNDKEEDPEWISGYDRGHVIVGDLKPGTWVSDTATGSVEVKPMLGPDGKPMDDKGSNTYTTVFGSTDGLLLTTEDLAAQKEKDKDAGYADDLNVYNIQQDADAIQREIQRDINNLNYLNEVTASDIVDNQDLHKYNEAVNLSNINAGIAAIDKQEAYNTWLTDVATNQANAQGLLNDFYAANPNSPRYGEEYGQGITSVIPDVAPNVFPVTGGGIDSTSGGNYDYGDAYIPDATSNVSPITGGGGFGGGGGKSDDGDYEVSAMSRGGIASLPKSPGQKLLAAHRAGDMATVYRMLRKVRR
jgi:hypothetical protein